MRLFKRMTALVLVCTLLSALAPSGTLSVRADSVSETFFPSNALSKFKLAGIDYNHDGNMVHEKTMAGNFSKLSEENIYKNRLTDRGNYSGYASDYPERNNYYRSANMDSENWSWSYIATWTPSGDDYTVLKSLLNSDNKLQLSGRYDGYRDTQGGKTAGLPTYTVSVIDSSSTYHSVSHTLSGSASTCKYHSSALGWVDIPTDAVFFMMDLYGSKGTGGIRKDREYARIVNPAVYMRDQSRPKIKSVWIDNNSDGNKKFAYNDYIYVNVKFTEPIRIKDKNYSSAFNVKANGLDVFTPVSYSDYNQTVRFAARVGDTDAHTVSKGMFDVKISVNGSYVTDLAGNNADDVKSKSYSDTSVVVSGLLPRIENIKISGAELADGNGGYKYVTSADGTFRPGDRLYVDVTFNQEMQSTSASEAMELRFGIGDEDVSANISAVYMNNTAVKKYDHPEYSNGLSQDLRFNRLTFCLIIPDDVDHNAQITLASEKSGDKWKLTGNQAILRLLKGNTRLEYINKQFNLQDVTLMIADGTSIISGLKVDKNPPVITVTDENGNAVSVYETPSEAEDVASVQNEYKLTFRSDEEVDGNLKVKVCYSEKNGSDKGCLIDAETAAYTSAPSQKLVQSFIVPEGIDSKSYDIWAEVTASDKVGNTGTSKFYFAADRKAPVVSIASEEAVSNDDGTKFYRYDFELNDSYSKDGSRIYYRFDNSDEYFFVDSDNGFVVTTETVDADSAVAGTISYYGVDGKGNPTQEKQNRYFMADLTAVCQIVNEEDTGKYYPCRDIEFTGFESMEETSAGDMADYLVYSIGDVPYDPIMSEDGSNIFITSDKLYDGCVIKYKKVRTFTSNPDFSIETPEFFVIYHCDDNPPDSEVTLQKTEDGLVEQITFASPGKNHPANIESMTISLGAEILDVTDEYVHNGEAFVSFYPQNVLRRYGLPSGRYDMKVTVTDANGHTSVETLLDNEAIIVDAPQIRNIRVVSAAEADPWDAEAYIYASSPDTSVAAEISARSVDDFVHDPLFDGSADAYVAVFDVYMRFEGDSFPRGDGSIARYVISADGGLNWSEYTSNGMYFASDEADFVDIDGEKYAVYKMAVPLPSAEKDGSAEYLVRVKVNSNPFVSDVADIKTLTDTTPPSAVIKEIAVGSDENGWYEEIDYTNDCVKINVDAADDGFVDADCNVKIVSIRDKNGDLVPAGSFGDYANAEGGDIIVCEPCTIGLAVADVWGNVAMVSYQCMWIDEVETGYYIYDDVNTDGYSYVLIKNYSSVRVSAEMAGSTQITSDGVERFRRLTEEKIISGECLYLGSALRDGDSNSAYRIQQNAVADSDYSILVEICDRRGNITTFELMKLLKSTEPVTVEPYENTVTNSGKVIRTVQELRFNKPVCQLPPDIVQDLRQGAEFEASEIDMSNMVFSDRVFAILDKTTLGDVYVTDRYGNICHVSVDVTGTEFTDYGGYQYTYYDWDTPVSYEHIYGKGSKVKIQLSGNNGVSAFHTVYNEMNVEYSEPIVVGNMEYYGKVSMEVEGMHLGPAGYAYSGDIKIVNTTNGEEYKDVVVFRYDTKAPVLLDAIEIVRRDIYDKKTVAYIFHDEGYIVSCEEDVGNGFEPRIISNGIYVASYLENCNPVIRITDSDENVLLFDGIVVDDVISENSFVQDRDFRFDVRDADGNIVEEGRYYPSVTVSVLPVDGGNSFTCDPEEVTVSDEKSIFFRLTGENGKSMIVRYNPPVDATPPSVNAVQNNSGGIVNEIVYTVLVYDNGSGIDRVYAVDAEGKETLLQKSGSYGIYDEYKIATERTDEYVIYAVDKLGNLSETKVSSNSKVVGVLKIKTEFSKKTITNGTVRVTFSAEDGRRIYSCVADDPANTIPADKYTFVGNTLSASENGCLKILCRDETGTEVVQTIELTNIDNTAPIVTYSMTNPVGEDGITIDNSVARITFAAEGEDVGAGRVSLIRKKDDFEESGYTDQYLYDLWERYTADPAAFRNDESFNELTDAVFIRDIHDPFTYVDIYSNGVTPFYFSDKAGNITVLNVNVDIVDSVPPEIAAVKWRYSYADGEYFDTTAISEGDAELVPIENTAVEYNKSNVAGVVSVSKETTGHFTNKSVDVYITADEPVAIYGEEDNVFSTSIRKSFYENGNYRYILTDRAGNLTEVYVNVSNILKNELYIDLEYPDDEVIVYNADGVYDDFDPAKLDAYKVYSVDAGGKSEMSSEEYTVSVNYNGFNPEDIASNTFNASRPYTIVYNVWDKAGNKASRTKKIVLCSSNDMLVSVDGMLPDASYSVITDKKEVVAEVLNYNDIVDMKLIKGQYNGAQMKTRGARIIPTDGKYHLKFDSNGWYTLYARTLFQDIYTIKIYVQDAQK